MESAVRQVPEGSFLCKPTRRFSLDGGSATSAFFVDTAKGLR